jgi:hypothetical protein
MERLGIQRRARWLWAALLLAALWTLVCNTPCVNAQRAEAVASEMDVVGGEEVAALDDPTRVLHTKKTVATTRTRIAATIQTTRIAGSGVQDQHAENTLPASVEALEECRPGATVAQCSEDPADALPSVEKPKDQRLEAVTTQEIAVGDLVASHVQELQDRVRVWLPQLKATVAGVVKQLTETKESLAIKTRAAYQECVVLYNLFLADAVDVLAVVYHRVAVATADVYAVISSHVGVLVGHAQDVWETHEEVRIVTRHVVSVVLLVLLGAVFFSVYALVGTVPDTVSAMWTSLDDLTRAQLKIVSVLVAVFTVYRLRAFWSFWLLLGSILTFYYWSGHVLAKAMGPSTTSATTLQRSASRLGKPKTL